GGPCLRLGPSPTLRIPPRALRTREDQGAARPATSGLRRRSRRRRRRAAGGARRVEGQQAAARTAPRSRHAPAPPPVSRTRPRSGPASTLAATPAVRGGFHAFPPRLARAPVHRAAPEGMTRGALVHLHA